MLAPRSPVQERAEERARGKPEPSFEVGDEDHSFPGFRGWLDLARGTPTFDAIGNSPSSPQPGELGLGHLGPFPSGALAFLDIVVRGMAGHDESILQQQRLPVLVRCRIILRQVKGRLTELQISTKSYRNMRLRIKEICRGSVLKRS